MTIHNVSKTSIPRITLYKDHLSAFLLSFIMTSCYIGIAFPLLSFWIGALSFTILAMIENKTQFIYKILQGIKTFSKSSIFILAALTLLSFGISAGTSDYVDHSISKWTDVLLIALGGGIWYFHLRSLTSKFTELFFQYLFWLSCIISSAFMIESIVWKLTGLSLHSERFFESMRALGAVFSIFFPFIIAYALKKEKIWAWLGACLCITTIFFCGGRSGVVTFTIIAILFAYFFPWGTIQNWGKSLAKYIATIILSAAVGTAGYYFMAGKETFIQRVASERAATGSGRIDIWSFAWEHFLQSPLFGIGPQMFRYLDFTGTKLSSTSHPHNIVLELLLETGIIGTTLLASFTLLVIFKCVLPAHRKIMTDTKNLRILIMITLIGLTAYFISSQFLTSFFHGWWLTYPTILIAMLGGVFAIYSREEKKHYEASNLIPYPIKVTAIMPCHNGATFIAAAIDSVRNQTETDWELLIINDGSQDNSQIIIDKYVAMDVRIKSFIHPVALGAGAARNTGLNHAAGRYVAFLDCDDLWKPQKLSIQIDEMQKVGAALSTTHYDVIDDHGQISGHVTPSDHVFTFGRLLKCNDIGCSVAMIDQSLIKNLRFPDFQRAQDFVFWCNILAQGFLCLCIHKNLGAYRIHKNSRTSNKIHTSINRIILLKKAIKVPSLIIPYYIGFYILYGITKQLRSGEKFPFHNKSLQQIQSRKM